MEQFNKILGQMFGGSPIDADTATGDFGKIDAGDAETSVTEPPTEDMFIVKLEGGVEIHLPMSVCTTIAEVISGQGGGQCDGHGGGQGGGRGDCLNDDDTDDAEEEEEEEEEDTDENAGTALDTLKSEDEDADEDEDEDNGDK